MPGTRLSRWSTAFIPYPEAAAAAVRAKFDCTAPVIRMVSA